MAAVHDDAPLRLQLLKAPSERKFNVGRVHQHSSRSHFNGAATVTHLDLNIGIPLAEREGRLKSCAQDRTADIR